MAQGRHSSHKRSARSRRSARERSARARLLIAELPIEIIEYVAVSAGPDGFPMIGRLRQVCRAWRSASLFAVCNAHAFYCSGWITQWLPMPLENVIAARLRLLLPTVLVDIAVRAVARNSPFLFAAADILVPAVFADKYCGLRRVLEQACIFSRLEVLSLLIKNGATVADFVNRGNNSSGSPIFLAATLNHAGVFELLAREFPPNSFPAAVLDKMVLTTAVHNSPDVLRVLRKEFGASADSVPVEVAAERGFVTILKVLRTEFNAVATAEALEMAVRKGQTDALNVLLTEYKVNFADFPEFQKTEDYYQMRRIERLLFDMATEKGCLGVLRVMGRNVGPEPARFNHNNALRTAVIEKNTRLLSILAKDFRLTADDVRDSQALFHVCRTDDYEFAHRIVKEFSLTADDVFQEMFNVREDDHYGAKLRRLRAKLQKWFEKMFPHSSRVLS